MRMSRLAYLLALATFSAGTLGVGFASSAMAQSGEETDQSAAEHDPDMQADTIEGEGKGASAQYEMGNEDGQTSDDIDGGDPSSISAKDQQDKGETIRHEDSGEEH